MGSHGELAGHVRQGAVRVTAQIALQFDPVAQSVQSSALQRMDAERLRNHEAAMRQPRPGFEAALVRMLGGMTDYAEAHSKAYDGTLVTQDYYIGDAWERLGNALHDLLSGETGRLDCSAMSSSITRLLEGEGKPAAIAAVREETMPPKPDPKDQTIGIGRSALSDRQRQLLAHVEVKDNLAIYTSTERIPDWELLKRVMLALGGTWKTGGKKAPGGFRFPDDLDAAELVRLAKETGEIIDPKAAEFFWTGDDLADELAAFVAPSATGRYLEPSAGKGALAHALRRQCGELVGASIDCFEPLDDNRKALFEAGFNLLGRDFLEFDPLSQDDLYDGIVANPPFSKRADVIHITRMLDWLKPGGRLAAIASSGVKHRNDGRGREFRALIERHGGVILDNAEGSFLHAGTGVRTVRILLTKDGAT
jgi:hypothetical protein